MFHDVVRFTAMKAHFYKAHHDGPIVTIQRSPFFKDIVLVIGGWSFSIWKEGIYVSTATATGVSAYTQYGD